MKKAKELFVILLTLMVMAVTLVGCSGKKSSNTGSNSSTAGEKTVIRLSTSGITAPFTFVDGNNRITGYDIEVARAVFEKLPQYELIIDITEIASALPSVDAGRVHMSANNWNKTEKRKEKYLFSDPIIYTQYVAIFKNGKQLPKIEGFSDLAGLTTVLVSGSNEATVLEKYNEQNPSKQIIVKFSEANFGKMIQDVEDSKYDFVLWPKVMYLAFQAEYNFDIVPIEVNIDITNSLLNNEPYAYFIIGAGNDQLLVDVNKGLAEIIKEGKVKEISEKFFSEDFSPYIWYENSK
jgi:polar amino acid transport system substrate-binding protein